MDSPSDDPPRVKLLCSFGGSILPRPLDGRLRYVGGETRIVTVPRDVSFSDLLSRMRDLFDAAAVTIRYQQPDEDLDALVSVVNDDDVTNMMEEYDKLVLLSSSPADTLIRLRLFLDPAPPSPHSAADDRDAERRYVDALNSIVASPPDPPDLHHLNIQRFPGGEADSPPPWSPAYFSPNPREYPPSPRWEFNDRIPVPDEFARQSPAGHQQSPRYMENNMVWLPPGSVIQEQAGFPSNLGHTHTNAFDGGGSRSIICEHCRMVFQRNQLPDLRWKHGQQQQQPPYVEQASAGNDYFVNSCGNCYRDVKFDHGAVYAKEQGEHQRPFYNEAHGHDRGWVLHHQQAGHRLEDPRVHLSGSSRVGEHYVVDGNAMNVSFSHGNFYDSPSVPSNCVHHEDMRQLRPGTEVGSEVFHAQQPVCGSPQPHVAGFEDTTIRYGNRPAAYGADNLYQVPQNLPPIQSMRRKAHGLIHPEISYESPGPMMPNGGMNTGFTRSPQDVSPRLSRIAMDNQIQNSWAAHNGGVAQKIPGFDGSAVPEFLYDHGPRPNQNIVGQDGRLSAVPDPVQCQPLHVEVPWEGVSLAPTLVDDTLVSSTAFAHHPFSMIGDTDMAPRMRLPEERTPVVEIYESKHEDLANKSDEPVIPSPIEIQNLDIESNKWRPVEGDHSTAKVVGTDADGNNEQGDISLECLSFLPELIASVKKTALESAEVVKATAEANINDNLSSIRQNKEGLSHELEPANACADLEANSDGDSEHPKISKIEPTTAEAEALAKGLQTIRNDDLEEIRELGSGTYGSVYHGKWKGSDVAIKRIKASCFAGRPSERERLIADFWKEALLLSSLHHPNVVSFYGVVRDGPDGSLATVTEFMVNGSLKQFLQKKDRTIDRRKRLIIAMDAAFGMEYLHGKNIVHFDLKCENLLVNMRDPHRPICKIGDLGLSKVKQHTLVSGGVRGTLPWMAPELLSGKSNMVTEKIDVYSFGIAMWELLTGEEPYADKRCASIIGGIVNNTLRPQTPTWCDPEWKALMESCWSSDPGERPSFSEISQKLRKMAAAINVK